VASGVLVALTLVLLTPGIALADQENYYLGPEGVPQAQMIMNPLGGEMPNYDRGRDVEPGLLLERTALGLGENDAARHQQWLMNFSGQRLAGFPSMIVWNAAAGFEADLRGAFTVYVLDCDRTGSNCESLASKMVTVDTGAGGEWIETKIDLPELDHSFGEGRNLAVRIVVPSTSEADMMFAYGYPAHRSRLAIDSERPETAVSQAAFLAGAPLAARLSAPSSVDVGADLPAATAGPTLAPSEDVPASSIWPWLITLALCTAGLVAVGGVLMATLAKPGRHVNAPATPPSDRKSRVPV
jgi:hypothetical protein